MRVWAAATDTDNGGTEIEIFATEAEMQDWLLEQYGTNRAEWEASGLDLCDFMERNQDMLDTYTWTRKDL